MSTDNRITESELKQICERFRSSWTPGRASSFAQQQPEHWETYSIQSTLGFSIANQGKLDQAGEILEIGYKGLKKHASQIPENQRNKMLRDALTRLLNVAELKKNSGDVERWNKELELWQDAEKVQIGDESQKC